MTRPKWTLPATAARNALAEVSPAEFAGFLPYPVLLSTSTSDWQHVALQRLQNSLTTVDLFTTCDHRLALHLDGPPLIKGLQDARERQWSYGGHASVIPAGVPKVRNPKAGPVVGGAYDAGAAQAAVGRDPGHSATRQSGWFSYYLTQGYSRQPAGAGQIQFRAVTAANRATSLTEQLCVGGIVTYLDIVVAQEAELPAEIAAPRPERPSCTRPPTWRSRSAARGAVRRCPPSTARRRSSRSACSTTTTNPGPTHRTRACRRAERAVLTVDLCILRAVGETVSPCFETANYSQDPRM